MRVMVGGTFDPLHAGHRKLLTRSFQVAGQDGLVTIGITTDEFAGSKIHPVRPFEERRRDVEEFIRENDFAAGWMIEPLSDRYGSALEADFDALVVSEETFPVAVEINELRRNRGRKKVDIHEISCVLAEDGRRISSTRIYRGEIDSCGQLVR
ncbi:phosphopantetheine adenylyltransferase [Methanoculleus taiwanensis]|uniref:Phosphopantetheine adenylyltransferase n=1 Tax=Methanoculleus taiwanensis TaxID=1550565 RepID=A0A498GZR5_9EURY|nr:phosphopantetheine adenylyltransferase [Methanoculleus taiwanensis]RXE55136.1 phosphopantetheine adenylyltransferase [Methanoculleus taiwanensis]